MTLLESTIGQFVITHDIQLDLSKILLAIQSAIIKHLPRMPAFHMETVFYRAQIIVSETLQRNEGFKRMQLARKITKLRGFTHNMNSTYTVAELLAIIAADLPGLGVPGCYLILYQAVARKRQTEKWMLPKNSKLVMAYNQKGQFISEANAKLFPTREICPNGVIPAERRFTLIAQSLYNRTLHFGFILCELGTREEIVYNTIQDQINTTLHTALLFDKRKQSEAKLKVALADLEKVNLKLRNLSLEDELTGLYNRRGFFLLAEQHYRFCQREGRKFAVFFGDIDGLKLINDLYGHREGDNAILQTANILRNTFRESDIIGRFGGDEFIVIGIDDSEETIVATQKRFTENIARCNENLNKPYQVSISLGAVEFNNERSLSLDELIAAADQKLYKQKLLKKLKTEDTT